MSTQSMSTNRPYQDEPSTLDSSESRDSFQNEPRGIQGGFKDDPDGETFTGDTSYQIGGVTPPTPSSTTSASPLSFHLNELWHNLCQGFTSLRDSPPELYKAFVLKFLDSYSYFSFSIIFTLFLSNDFGMDDVTAGTLYGAWGALITIYGLLTGFVVDNLGVARSLRLGFALSLLARIGIFMTTSKTMLYFHICGTLPLANCLGIPVLTTGIRRYTNETNRGFAFGLFYVIMNVAALISG
jgi:Major Facilitator Superfamily